MKHSITAVLAFMASTALALEPMQDETLQSESSKGAISSDLQTLSREYPSLSRPFPSEKISKEQWQSFLDEKLKAPGAKTFEDPSTIKVVVPSIPAVYIFTKQSSSAYPAVELRIYSKDKRSLLVTWLYACGKEEFEGWYLTNKARWPLSL